MALSELLGFQFRYRDAVVLGTLIAFAASIYITPHAIRKLRGAGITGLDRHKPDRPTVPEMGGLAVFLAFNMGAFAALALGGLHDPHVVLLLSGLIVAVGAALTGALDDLIVMRQGSKALIPFAFAIPLALFVFDTTIAFPFIGTVDFGIAYAVILVPLGVACASNGFNMLEGFNGLGSGLGLILSLGLGFIILFIGEVEGLTLLSPLWGALAGFWLYNRYPARIFPGDTLMLMIGAVLASSAIVGKVELWGALLLAPHVIEFFLKARGHFQVESFATRQERGLQVHEGPIRSLTHVFMRLHGPVSEKRLVLSMYAAFSLYAALIVALAVRFG